MKTKNILLIAGEVSGDQHAAELVQKLRAMIPDVNIWGIGGDELQRQGMEIVVHLNRMAFLGVGEVVRHLPFIKKVMQQILQRAKAERPDCALLVDYPGFNLRMARRLKKLGIPVLYYISPQLWAWGRRRVKIIRQYVDEMLVLFPFEKDFYEAHGIKAQYVGHPLVDRHHPHLPAEFKEPKKGEEVLGLLPGSRRNEVQSLLPRMVKAAQLLQEKGLVKQVFVARVGHLEEDLYRRFLPEGNGWKLVELPMKDLLPKLDAALVASGTATLETAYYAVPMVIVYHVNALTYWLGRMLIKVSHIGLANIVAEQEIAPELIQNDFTSERAAEILEKMLNPPVNRQLRERMLIIREKLGEPGASQRAALKVFEFLQRTT